MWLEVSDDEKAEFEQMASDYVEKWKSVGVNCTAIKLEPYEPTQADVDKFCRKHGFEPGDQFGWFERVDYFATLADLTTARLYL